MEDAIGYGLPNLFVGPRGITVAKTNSHQRAHAAIHPESLLEALLRSHGAIDRNLVRVGFALMVRFCDHGHIGMMCQWARWASFRRRS
jgi:hypothetical protein